ncbi:MAG: hypothetical protein AB2392_15505 [Neobacillus sp.]
MLSTTVTFDQPIEISTSISPFLKKKSQGHFQIYLEKIDKLIAEIKMNKNVVTLEYSSELLLEEYIIIHNLISQLREMGAVEIDDSRSFLGYLADGEPAFIVTNWRPWLTHINNSMKNCL